MERELPSDLSIGILESNREKEEDLVDGHLARQIDRLEACPTNTDRIPVFAGMKKIPMYPLLRKGTEEGDSPASPYTRSDDRYCERSVVISQPSGIASSLCSSQ